MIVVIREPIDLGGPPYECCAFCNEPTPYWYEPKDVAVCPICAEKVEDADVPSKMDWFKRRNLKVVG